MFNSLRTGAIAGLVFGGLAVLSTPAQAQNGPPAAIVRIGEIVELDMARTITTPASVIARNDARIAAEASGRIIMIAEPGEYVEAGGVIAQLDNRQARIQLDEARANLARSTANASYQQAEAERFARLAENGTVPPTRLREVELARDLALQDQRQARANMQRAELELERTQILAPFAGRVAERLIEVGELSAPGREIARLVDTEHTEAIAMAPVAIAPYLQVGQTVSVSLSEGESIQAPIRAIIPVGDAVSRTFEVRIDLEGTGWLVGSAARAAFPAETPRSQMAAPYDAVILRANGSFVFTVDAENIAHQVSVETGVSSGGFIAIDGEIERGQRVVVSGAETLSEGRPVQEQQDDA